MIIHKSLKQIAKGKERLQVNINFTNTGRGEGTFLGIFLRDHVQHFQDEWGHGGHLLEHAHNVDDLVHLSSR